MDAVLTVILNAFGSGGQATMGAISAISSAAAGYLYGAGSGALAADWLQSGRLTDAQILLLALLVFGPAGAALGVLSARLRRSRARSAGL